MNPHERSAFRAAMRYSPPSARKRRVRAIARACLEAVLAYWPAVGILWVIMNAAR